VIEKWKAFLSENNTNFETIKDANEMLFDLTGQGLIQVSGEDAESFLQNQLTNDIRNVNTTTHQASAWCSPKGRIIANFQVFQRDENYFLTVSSDLTEHVIKKLRMYIMMSKVTVEDVSDSMLHFAYSGNLQKIISDVPTNENQTLQQDNLSILKVYGDDRYEIFGSYDDAKVFWEKCIKIATPVNTNGWNLLNIASGTPLITNASSEAWIPQMVNYIAIGGVDFKKGCYPGQEVVARLNYLGKTKRRMYRLKISTNQLPNVGDTISTATDKEAGKILNAALTSNGDVEVLAIIKIAESSNTLTLTDNAKASISILDLPYSINDE